MQGVVTMRGFSDHVAWHGGRPAWRRLWHAVLGGVVTLALVSSAGGTGGTASGTENSTANGLMSGTTNSRANRTVNGVMNSTANSTANGVTTSTAPTTNTTTAQIARGAYLAKAADCAGCHTAPPRVTHPGAAPTATPAFAGGLGMVSPFGTIYSSNITPDPRSGIGRYSYDDFARAVREGVAPGGKRLYPAMPYPSFAKIDDADMHSLYAYFMHGVQPVAAPAPATRLPFPFNQRWALAVWNWAFAPSGPFKPEPTRDAQWNRGAYLAQSLGHCGACHTPRGAAYEERGYSEADPLFLTGGTNDHWFAPNLTGDPGSGLGRHSAADIAAFLKHGHGGGLIAFGSMVQVVEDSTQYLRDADLAALAAYLKSLPPRAPSGHFNERSRAARQSVQALKTGDVERPGAGLYAACARVAIERTARACRKSIRASRAIRRCCRRPARRSCVCSSRAAGARARNTVPSRARCRRSPIS